MRRVIRRAVVDLPHPLSPTRPKVFPSGTENEIWSTALSILLPASNRLITPPLTSKCLVRPLTSRIGIINPVLSYCFLTTCYRVQCSKFNVQSRSPTLNLEPGTLNRANHLSQHQENNKRRNSWRIFLPVAASPFCRSPELWSSAGETCNPVAARRDCKLSLDSLSRNHGAARAVESPRARRWCRDAAGAGIEIFFHSARPSIQHTSR